MPMLPACWAAAEHAGLVTAANRLVPSCSAVLGGYRLCHTCSTQLPVKQPMDAVSSPFAIPYAEQTRVRQLLSGLYVGMHSMHCIHPPPGQLLRSCTRSPPAAMNACEVQCTHVCRAARRATHCRFVSYIVARLPTEGPFLHARQSQHTYVSCS
jgi:hypothetical protein